MVTASDKAIEKLREQLIRMCFEEGIGFRLVVTTDKGGRASFSIKADKQRRRDKVIDSGEVKLFLDPTSADRVRDYQLDYCDQPRGGFYLNARHEGQYEQN